VAKEQLSVRSTINASNKEVNMKKRNLALCIGIAVLGLAGAPMVQAQNTNQSAGQSEGQLGKVQRAQTYIGKDIQSENGEKLGQVEDFVVDLESGRILFAVVNANKASRGVPAELLQPDADQKSLQVKSDKEHINNAPVIQKGESAQLSSAAFAQSIAKHFGQTTWYHQGDGSTAGGKDFGNVHRVSQLSNMEVQSSSNEKVGKIQNVLLDLKTGYVTFLILEPAEMPGQNQKLAVPPNAFTKGSANTLITGVDKDTLSNAPKFNNNWSELSDTSKAGAIYSHYGKKPYWNLSPTGRE
jgi:sporulation protein YlmC with PRC-barrel domain